MIGRVAILAALALACGACGDRNAPSRAEVATARDSVLVKATAGNPEARDFAELVAIGRKVKAEQAAKR